ncbi:conserved protein of unknown function [Methylocella tundrae]|uniref:Uncharacterized protein n=1 Tax=Methylocella tundrae TaxID=227605 RepID=A0A4U8Z5U5_METTU|nr:conserved protein of unknown function [Methylocella tundrae]
MPQLHSFPSLLSQLTPWLIAVDTVEAAITEAAIMEASIAGACIVEASIVEASIVEASIGEASIGEASIGEAMCVVAFTPDHYADMRPTRPAIEQ